MRKQLEQGAKAQKVKDAKSKKSSSSSSSSKRKVVVNGETVVDEETKDGKPVNGKKPGKRPAVGKGKG